MNEQGYGENASFGTVVNCGEGKYRVARVKVIVRYDVSQEHLVPRKAIRSE